MSNHGYSVDRLDLKGDQTVAWMNDDVKDEAVNPHLSPTGEKGRVTVQETVYFQPSDSDFGDVAIPCSYVEMLTTGEQPVQRWLTVTEKWVELPKGWLEQASLLILSNLGPPNPLYQPSQREIEDREKAIVEVALIQFSYVQYQEDRYLPITHLSPQRNCRWKPVDLSLLRLRCLKGSTKVLINLLPV